MRAGARLGWGGTAPALVLSVALHAAQGRQGGGVAVLAVEACQQAVGQGQAGSAAELVSVVTAHRPAASAGSPAP